VLLGRAIQGVVVGGIFPVANAFIGDIFHLKSAEEL
jgi:MFS family permease